MAVVVELAVGGAGVVSVPEHPASSMPKAPSDKLTARPIRKAFFTRLTPQNSWRCLSEQRDRPALSRQELESPSCLAIPREQKQRGQRALRHPR